LFDDLAAAIAFFVELGLELEDQTTVRNLGLTASSGSPASASHRDDAYR